MLLAKRRARNFNKTHGDMNPLLSLAVALPKITLEAHNLEQQAVACDWLYKNVSDLSNRNYKAIKSRSCQLRTKAKALQDKQ